MGLGCVCVCLGRLGTWAARTTCILVEISLQPVSTSKRETKVTFPTPGSLGQVVNNLEFIPQSSRSSTSLNLSNRLLSLVEGRGSVGKDLECFSSFGKGKVLAQK